jgi:hypothetical protein
MVRDLWYHGIVEVERDTRRRFLEHVQREEKYCHIAKNNSD